MRETGKGHKTRLVPIGRKACEAIRNYITSQRSWLTAATRNRRPAKPRSELFLSEKRARPVNLRFVSGNSLKSSRTLAGFDKEIYPQLFRHSFATHLLENDCDLDGRSITTPCSPINRGVNRLQYNFPRPPLLARAC